MSVTRENLVYLSTYNMVSKEQNNKTGGLGEDIATKILVKKGFSIVERNYKTKFAEIDIIAEKYGTLHFIEVKTFSRENISQESSLGNGFESGEYRPEELVTPQKLKKIQKAADFYMFSREKEQEAQIDVIAITLNQPKKTASYKFLENVL